MATPTSSMEISHRFGMPPINSIASTTGTHTMQDPRFGWIRMRTQGAPTIAPQQRSLRNGAMARVYCRKIARVRMPAAIASSEGWKLIGPRSSQLLAPNRFWPNSIVATSRTMLRM